MIILIMTVRVFERSTDLLVVPSTGTSAPHLSLDFKYKSDCLSRQTVKLKPGDRCGTLEHTNPFNSPSFGLSPQARAGVPFNVVGESLTGCVLELASKPAMTILALAVSHSFADGGLKGVIATSGAHPLWWLLG
jgi:hypothetical protein